MINSANFRDTTLAHHHNYLALSPAVEFAEKNSLPTSQQQLSVRERNGNAGSDEAGFDMRVGILFPMTKAHAVLGNQSPEQVQHVTRHIRIGILVYGQTRRRMLDIEDNDALTRA